jgi:DNA invertase Pin-like site-specific DNA recombinase
MQNFVVYLRVSTDRQGISGLGMDAQREAVSRYVQKHGQIVGEYIEVESGRKADRPKLLAALEECRRRRAVLLIARLDRLARNVAFIANLMNSDVEFVAVDMPTANRLTIHILAAVAEHEREMISARTKAALAAARARGTKLGNPRYAEALTKARACIEYKRPSPEVMDLMKQWRLRSATLTDIADRLNRLHIPTPKGFHWYASTVRAALARLPEFQKARKDETQKSSNDDCVIARHTSSGLNGFRSRAIPSVSPLSTGRRGKTEGEMTMADLAESFRMLDTFASAGATHFDVTFLDIDGEKCGFRKEQTARQLRNSLPHLLPGLTERKQSLVIRPYGERIHFVQLDDLDYEQLKPLATVACLILQTSPGNHQAWVAVTDLDKVEAKDIARRLRKGTGADLNASGATRCAGTLNYKPKYGPDFPEVKILQAAPGRQTTKEQLESLALLAPPEAVTETPSYRYQASVAGTRQWPDYQRALQGAKLNRAGTGPDISGVDFYYSLMCAQRGFAPHEIAAALTELSPKVKADGKGYADRTATNAWEKAMDDKQRRSRA